MSRRPFPLESKAEAVRRALDNPCYAGWPKKEIRSFAIANWKARKGNLNGRPHPSLKMPWHHWLRLTAKRYANRMARIEKAKR